MKHPGVVVIGTGIMGSAMARNLARAGLPTTAWNRSAPALAALADAGVRAAPSAVEGVRGAEIVITMLPTADVISSVIFDSGTVDALERGATWARIEPGGPDGDEHRSGTAPCVPRAGSPKVGRARASGPLFPRLMRAYVLSLAVGLLMGVLYGLLGIRSPAPPVVALIGLLGMLLGEQGVVIGQRMLSRKPVTMSWLAKQCAPPLVGTIEPHRATDPEPTARGDVRDPPSTKW